MKKFLFPFLLICLLTPLAAQELSLIEKQAPKRIAFAQPFALQYDFSHTPGYLVELDEQSLSPDFEIKDRAVRQNSPGTVTFDFTVLPFTLGKSTFTATFLLSQNGKTAAKAEDETFITVAPAKTFDDKNLREIRPPQIPAGWLTWLLAALAALALAGVLWFWYKKTREKSLAVLQQQAEDNRPSDEIALSKIDALLNSGLWEQRHYKLFYITLSDILREYLWRQFKIDASADTSAELLRRVKNMPAMAPLLYALRSFLSSGDLVKFAKAVPEEAVRNKDIQLLRQIIRETSPKETLLPPKEDA
ncbi:MAG: hypothetical protein PUC11_00520 [Elusimicrobia bacterium]|nr:hypothetical protein [Elusimicrobiota bacterium]